MCNSQWKATLCSYLGTWWSTLNLYSMRTTCYQSWNFVWIHLKSSYSYSNLYMFLWQGLSNVWILFSHGLIPLFRLEVWCGMLSYAPKHLFWMPIAWFYLQSGLSPCCTCQLLSFSSGGQMGDMVHYKSFSNTRWILNTYWCQLW